ncbi:MAG: glycosyltransferase [Rhodobacteraceae bacterium]|jgi:cellulose synthase/poly-beta-1,6-N-acetylglucosamine synthase-like glycosyltransferase|nr:glycosyltransferase [Paracoccaceae bacterium]
MSPPSVPLRLVVPPLRSEPRPAPLRDRGAAAVHSDLGEALVALGALEPADLATARAAETRSEVDLADVLRARGLVADTAIADAQALVHATNRADFRRRPPDPALADDFGLADCLRQGVLPWHRTGSGIVVATDRPDRFAEVRDRLTARHGRVFMAIATRDEMLEAILPLRRRLLAARAETRVPEALSCRTMSMGGSVRSMVAGSLAVVVLMAAAPLALFIVALGAAVLALVAMTVLRLMAIAIALSTTRPAARPAGSRAVSGGTVVPLMTRMPVVSLLVPLFREREIAGRLVTRLARLDWPAELLDILLVVEEDDATTRATLAAADLPATMRTVVVPRGAVRTKPRALNYALDHARGSIIGVYDAEDAPEPDQIRRIVDRFQSRGPDVACLQGVLDYYNPRQSWITRCFTVEYAGWFRVMLPALEHLRLPVPLGGTTLFFRRAALERLGAWDAHNVTEDADLGMRLARAGLRTELVDTVTFEEATASPGAWVRQRSRWLKGYAITWAVHMRQPGQLWRDLGPRGFLGFQVLFLGTLAQVLLAPLLWSFWLYLLTGWHPAAGGLPGSALAALAATFLVAEASVMTLGMVAVRDPARRWLMPWVPTLHLYQMAATAAAWKGLWEIMARPFYWEKTSHGHSLTRRGTLGATPGPGR